MDNTFFAGTFSAGDTAQHILSSLTAAPTSTNLKSPSAAVIKAHKTNTGIIWLGHDANVAANNGFPLDAGDFFPIDIANLVGRLFILQSVGADKFSIAVVKP